jgi:magnesium-transporting ATPase (P-type)
LPVKPLYVIIPAMEGPEQRKRDPKQTVNNLTLAVVAGQVGCLTLIIVLIAVLGGLWLDNQFQTRPVITILLVVVSVPISLFVMFAVVRAAVARIKPGSPGQRDPQKGGE